MSGKTYPRIGRTSRQLKWDKLPMKAAPKCSACDKPARFRVDVEVNYFRGDDECGRACADHKDDAAALLEGIARHQAEMKARREAVASMQSGFKPPAKARPPEDGDIGPEAWEEIDRQMAKDD